MLKQLHGVRRNWLTMIVAACATLPLVLPAPTRAMGFERVEGTLILSGPVVDGDLARLRDALANKGLRQVLLHNSPGGDAWTGLRLGREIRQAGLNTLLSGQCASACGLMFLGGVERRPCASACPSDWPDASAAAQSSLTSI